MRQRVLTDNDRRRFLRKLYKFLRIALVAAIVAVLAVWNALAPLYGMLPAYAIPAREEGELRVHFLSVGEGDCAIVEFPDGALLLIDAGDGSFTHANRVLRYIKGLSRTSLTFVATHADLDHYGGFVQLFPYCAPDAVYLPVVEGGGAHYQKFLSLTHNKPFTVGRLTRYGVIENPSGAYVVCISPYSDGETSENDSSIVLYLEYEGVRFLFCADISATREKRLFHDYTIAEGMFDSKGHTVRLEGIDVLKASHHGSAYSSSAEWLELLSPAEAVLSIGAGNRDSHPSPQAVLALSAAGANVYRTDELGDIVVSVKDGDYVIKTA